MIKSLSKKETEELIVRKKGDKNFVILDIRTSQEFASGAIEGAVNIDFYEPGFKDIIDALDKNKTYLIYCRSGSRSKDALGIMEELNFKEVYELDSGLFG